jgi:hypothetical protein
MVSIRKEFNQQTHVIISSTREKAEAYIHFSNLPPENSVYLSSVDMFPSLNVASVRMHPMYQWFEREDHEEVRDLLAEFTRFNIEVNSVNFDCIYRP